MKTEPVHTLILGSGPSGLAGGYTLAKAGLRPVILEKDKVCGGLMRSIKRGDFIMDVGRKELYNRLERVDALWTEILGSDYRIYEHRGGVLYDGHIIEISPAYQGFRRGMPWGMFVGCCVDLAWNRAKPGAPKPRNVEEYFYHQRGRRLTQIVAQGFQEKITGKRWAEVPLAENQVNGNGSSFFQTAREGLSRAFSKKEVNTHGGTWRHPARGTGQICEALEHGILKAGGRIHYETRILEITSTGDCIHSVKAEVAGETIEFHPSHVVSSIPLEFLLKLLNLNSQPSTPDSQSPDSAVRTPPSALKKTVILIYLFLNEPAQFPHAWLNITCPKTKMGRITNYAALNGDMVPKGKTCLCCEYYCFGDDPLLALDNNQLAERALEECARFRLLDATKCFDKMVVKFPGADASQSRHTWLTKSMRAQLAQLKPLRGLYYVNRSDLDISTLAGIESAEAIISGDRTLFDRHLDPNELGIRSETKKFGFKAPVSQES